MTHNYCLGTYYFPYIIFSKKYKVGMVLCYQNCSDLHVLSSFELLSYCGLVDSKIRASEKDLPVNHEDGTANPFSFAFTRFICTVVVQRTVNQTKYLVPRQ